MTFKKNFCVAAIASLLISPLTLSASYTDNEIRIGYLADMSGPLP